jgi:serine/threonine protein kinase
VATSAHPVPFPHPIRYIAPEIVKGTGHGKAADYYALGCFLYECISGWTPYVRDDEYGLSIYRYVVKNPVEAPEGMATDSPAWILLSAMLEKDPAKRIGTLQAGCVLELMNQLTLLAPCLLAHPPPPPPKKNKREGGLYKLIKHLFAEGRVRYLFAEGRVRHGAFFR